MIRLVQQLFVLSNATAAVVFGRKPNSEVDLNANRTPAHNNEFVQTSVLENPLFDTRNQIVGKDAAECRARLSGACCLYLAFYVCRDASRTRSIKTCSCPQNKYV